MCRIAVLPHGGALADSNTVRRFSAPTQSANPPASPGARRRSDAWFEYRAQHGWLHPAVDSRSRKPEGHADVLDTHETTPVVLVAVGDRQHLGDRRGALGMGDRRRCDGAGELSDRAGGRAAPVRPRSRVLRRLPGVRRHHRRRQRQSVRRRQQPRAAQQRRRVLPADARGDRRRRASITIEAYIYWAGEIGREFADALAERAKAGLPGQDSAGRDRVGEHRLGHSRHAGSRRVPGRLVQPDPLVHAGPIQQPHASEVADRRRPDRLHRRRRHRRSLAGQRPRARRVARHAGSPRGPGRRPAADRVRAQLAADDRRAADRGCVLSGHRRQRPAGGADAPQLAGNRRLERADDVLPVDRVRPRIDLHRQSRTSCPIPSPSRR